MKVTIKHYSADDETYTTNIPLWNIMELNKDNYEGYMFRLIDGSWKWYHVSKYTGEKIKEYIKNRERDNK